MSEGLSLVKRRLPGEARLVGNTRPKLRLDTEQSGARILQLSDEVLMKILGNLTTLELCTVLYCN